MDNHKHHLEELVNGNQGKLGSEISRATSPSGAMSIYNGQTMDGEESTKRHRPRTFPYFTTLPYPVEDEAQRQRNLSEILKHLYIAIQASDFTPGAVHWTRELRSWLSLKFDPTKEQRVKLVKLYYELALAPGIDPGVAERFASMFMLLTKYVSRCVRSTHHVFVVLTVPQAKALPTPSQRPHTRLEAPVPRTQSLCASQRIGPHADHEHEEKHQDPYQNLLLCPAILRPGRHTGSVGRVVTTLHHVEC